MTHQAKALRCLHAAKKYTVYLQEYPKLLLLDDEDDDDESPLRREQRRFPKLTKESLRRKTGSALVGGWVSGDGRDDDDVEEK